VRSQTYVDIVWVVSPETPFHVAVTVTCSTVHLVLPVETGVTVVVHWPLDSPAPIALMANVWLLNVVLSWA
jgi:hypothetical protein